MNGISNKLHCVLPEQSIRSFAHNAHKLTEQQKDIVTRKESRSKKSVSIVIDLDIFEYHLAHSFTIHQRRVANGFDLQRMEEAFCHSIIPAIPFSAYTEFQFMLFDDVAVSIGTILTTAGAMHDNTFRHASTKDHHFQCIIDKRARYSAAH